MRITKATSLLYDAALALVYPQACAVCGASVEHRANGAACASCWGQTRLFDGSEVLCWKCGALTEGVANVAADKRSEVRCHRCDAESFTAARACGMYEGALRAAVLALKREPHVSTRLLDMLTKAQQRAPLDAATRIVPVPLHAERQRERGFNQAAVLTRALARRTNLPLDEHSLVRATYAMPRRARMDERARRETVATAFTVARPRLIENACVLLVDDVFTTGATASACAGALIAAGAQAVFVLTIARAGA